MTVGMGLMNVLVIGSGGREHALAWKAAQSADVKKVFVAPGNAGTAGEANIENIDLRVNDFQGLADFAAANGVGLTIVGPEQPLVDGIVDFFQARDLTIFGPGKGAAQLEGSKAFTKDFLERHQIPTASYGNFTDLDQALTYLHKVGAPIVIKADGKVDQRELNFVRIQFVNMYGKQRANNAFKLFNGIIKKEVSLRLKLMENI